MGWLGNLLKGIAGATPTDWTLLESLPDPGLGIAGTPMKPDDCYIEVFVESLRLEKARRFATAFHGVVYSFISLARHGSERAEVASVTTPANLKALDGHGLGRVITVSKRVLGAVPWRGNPVGLELGLFSVKSGNLLSPLIDYVARVSEKAGISATTVINPFLPLVTEGLDLIAGQRQDTEIELAIDTDMALNESRLCALIALPKDKLSASDITIDPSDRKLLNKGRPLEAAYCVFSIRRTDRNPDWGAISALQQAFADFMRAIVSGRRKEAEEALAGFNRQVIVSPDLITSDKNQLKKEARTQLEEAFPGGGQAASDDVRRRFATMQLKDLRMYGS